MKKLHELITMCWKFGKWMFEQKTETVEDWRKLDVAATLLVKEVKDERENKFVRAVIVAMLEYLERGNNEKSNDIVGF